MKCRICGYSIPETANFCRQCGNRIDVEPQQIPFKIDGQQSSYSSQPVHQVPQAESKERKSLVLYITGGVVAALLLGICIGSFVMNRNNSMADSIDGIPMDIYEDDFTSFGEVPEYEPEENDFNVAEINGDEKSFGYGSGIHRYSYHLDDCTWDQAVQKAASYGGYLVHIDSQEEMDYIINELTELGYEKKQFLIGARRTNDSSQYYWVDEYNCQIGNPINNSRFWAAGEPSYDDGGYQEMCVDIFYYAKEDRWIFNDVPNDMIELDSMFEGRMGYIIEYED